MSRGWWAQRIGSVANPQPSLPAQQPYQPTTQGMWWQDQDGRPAGHPALAAQMPYSGAAGPQGIPQEQYIRQLQRIPAERLSQEQMEEIAQWELGSKAKYNSHCPQCSSSNFVPAGTVISGTRMGSDKCFECGASSSAYTGSPEPARGGGSASRAPYRDVRQIDTGGGSGSMYLRFNGMPSSYVPRGG